MRVFLDANVLFSAAKSNGAIRQLLNLLFEQNHECWIDHYVLIEARRNLAAKSPVALEALEALLARMKIAPGLAPSHADAETAWLPAKDRPVLAAAIRLRCDALVTGDRTHFGSGYGKTFGGVVLHSPRSLADSLLR